MNWTYETKLDYTPVDKIKIKFQRLNEFAVIPTFKTEGASGADLYSVMDLDILPGHVGIIDLGFAVSMPRGVEIQIRPRSGLAIHHGVTVLNSPGTVDSDYRGEMKVILINLGKSVFQVLRGDRIAQAVVSYVPSVVYEEMEILDETVRNTGGFGSTGKD